MPTCHPDKVPRHEQLRWQLAAAALTVAVLRLPFVGAAASVDEGGYTYIADQLSWSGSSLYGDMWLDRPPLVLILLKLAILGADLVGLEPLTGVRLLGCFAAFLLAACCASAARTLAGPAAGIWAAVVAASLASSALLGGIHTTGELLAASVGSGAVAVAVAALHPNAPQGLRRHLLLLAGSGILAAAAGLIKQSFIDAASAIVVACIAGMLVRGSSDRSRRRARAVVDAATVAASGFATVGASLLAARAVGIAPSDLVDAVWGFRADALRAIHSRTTHYAGRRLLGLGAVFIFCGIAPLLTVSLVSCWKRRSELGGRILALLVTWTAMGLVAIAFGGSFWRHYLLQLVPVTAVAAAIASTSVPRSRPHRKGATHTARALVFATVAVVGVCAATTFAWREIHPVHRTDVSAGRFLRATAEPGDTVVVLYARASVLYASGLPTDYPYAWSLMERARPDGVPRLRSLLESEQRPTFVAAWQKTTDWGLDPDGRTAALLGKHYRVSRRICGIDILVRRDMDRPPADTPERCSRDIHVGPVVIED